MVAITRSQDRSRINYIVETLPVRKVSPAGTTLPSVMKETLKYNSLAIMMA